VLKDNEFYSVTGLIDDISRAVKSDKALQANSITIALLANAIRQAATEKASAIGGAMPEAGQSDWRRCDDGIGPHYAILRLASSEAQRWLIISRACRAALLPAELPREHGNQRWCSLRSRAGH